MNDRFIANQSLHKKDKKLRTLSLNFDLKLQVTDDNDEKEAELDELEIVRQETPLKRFVNFMYLYSMTMST